MRRQPAVAILALSLVLAVQTAVYGAAVKVPLKLTDPPYSEVGFVIFNNPRGDTNFVLQISVKNAAKTNWDHYVYVYDTISGQYLFYSWPAPGGILHTNKVGKGNFHLSSHLPPGSYNLKVWINEEPSGHSFYVAGPVATTIY